MDRYPTAALIPESPWLADPTFPKIEWKWLIASDTTRTSLAWMPWEFPLMPSRWVLQVRRAGQWTTTILPGTRAGETFETAGADAIILTPISRTGALGIARAWQMPQPSGN